MFERLTAFFKVDKHEAAINHLNQLEGQLNTTYDRMKRVSAEGKVARTNLSEASAHLRQVTAEVIERKARLQGVDK
jgi:hypothetical protein